MSPLTCAKWIAGAYGLALGALILLTGAWSGNPIIVGMAVIGFIWMIGPFALTTLLVGRSATPAGAWAFVGLLVALLLFTVWIWYLLLVVDPDAQAPIALFIFIPMYEYAGLGAFVLLALWFGWRAREPGSANETGESSS